LYTQLQALQLIVDAVALDGGSNSEEAD